MTEGDDVNSAVSATSSSNRFPRLLMLALIVLTFALFDFWAPSLVRMFSTGRWTPVLYGLVGLFLVQLNLIAIFGALGPGRLLIRIMWCLLAIVVMFFAYSLGDRFLAGGRISPAFRGTMVYGSGLTTSLIGIGLMTFRGATGKRLAWVGAKTATSTKFSLRQLMVVTTMLCAMSAMLVASRVPLLNLLLFEPWLLVPAGIVAALGLTSTIPALGIAFRKPLGRAFGFVGIAFLGFVVTMVLLFLGLLMNRRWDQLPIMFQLALAFSCGQNLGLWLALLAVRAAGFELRTAEDDPLEMPPEYLAAREAAAKTVADPWSEEEGP